MKLSQLARTSFSEGYIVSTHPVTRTMTGFSSIKSSRINRKRGVLTIALDWTAMFDCESGEYKGVLESNEMTLHLSDLQYEDFCDGHVKVTVPEKQIGFTVMPVCRDLPRKCNLFLDGAYGVPLSYP